MSKDRIIGSIFILIAVLALIFSIVCFSLDIGDKESNKSYGGDAYTGIQNAAAQTATNVRILNKAVNKISGMAFIIVGLTFASLGLNKLITNEKKADAEWVDNESEVIAENQETSDSQPSEKIVFETIDNQ